MSTASKRPSALPAAPKPPITLSPKAVISDSASLTGTFAIKIGDNSVIHPRAKLNSAFGSVAIGKQCIVCERSCIGFQSIGLDESSVTIENGVTIEVGAVVEAARVGEGSVIEVYAKVGKGAVLGKYCKIKPTCSVADGEVLPDYMVVYGENQRRIDQSGTQETQMRSVALHTDILRKWIPSNPGKFQ
ncbi:MAG: hypothetical protein M1829_003307 [Trizodia sp. TS-e1964]|nr:MAG: hypothetical protein M1829_003307 [Trizodia sp. TS-e1964]